MITAIDHVVLTVRDIDASVVFYKRVLNMEHVGFGDNRHALAFGAQKINLQTLGQEMRNHACIGSGDLCLITEWRIEQLLDHLVKKGVAVVGALSKKSGSKGQ